MPFIDSKITCTLSTDQKDLLKAKLAKIITLVPGKEEAFLMVGFEDNYDLYFRGDHLALGAFVSIKLFGEPPAACLNAVTNQICDLYHKELNIPPRNIYITYEFISAWGWNNQNF